MQMIERPILFSTPMVQGVSEDRKTITRRLRGLERMNENPDYWRPYEGDYFIDKKGRLNQKFFHIHGGFSDHAICAYGNIGDILWVRETFLERGFRGNYAYKADEDCPLDDYEVYKPSIHMPKEVARFWFKITDIRVERLQDISEGEAVKEGVFKYGPFGEYAGSLHPSGGSMRYRAYRSPVRAFECIWESINGPKSWQLNPWVWVVQFKVLSKNGKPDLSKI